MSSEPTHRMLWGIRLYGGICNLRAEWLPRGRSIAKGLTSIGRGWNSAPVSPPAIEAVGVKLT